MSRSTMTCTPLYRGIYFISTMAASHLLVFFEKSHLCILVVYVAQLSTVTTSRDFFFLIFEKMETIAYHCSIYAQLSWPL